MKHDQSEATVAGRYAQFVSTAQLDQMRGSLPELMRFADGSPVETAEQWKRRRLELLDAAVNIGYGGMPPEPEVLQVEHLCGGGFYRILAGTCERTISCELELRMPKGEGRHPVLLSGYPSIFGHEGAAIRMFLDQGFIVATFHESVFAEDLFSFDRSRGLYPIYPEGRFGMLAARAWGYSRCVDALLTMDFVDPDCICITGQSRGGKVTLLAGATDERIAFTQTNCSGLFGSGCLRYTQQEPPESGYSDLHSETLENMLGEDVPWQSIGYWFGPDMAAYRHREEALPFDLHFLKAAVAPRGLLETNSVDDTWANPRGSYLTYRAAKEAYALLGADNAIASSYRYGPHGHTLHDFRMYLWFIQAVRQGRPFLYNNGDAVFSTLPEI